MTIEETTGATQASVRGGFRKRWKSILLETGRSIVDMDTSLRCAGVAFFGFLSLFPGIATVVLIYGLAADRENLADHAGTFQFVLPDSKERVNANPRKIPPVHHVARVRRLAACRPPNSVSDPAPAAPMAASPPPFPACRRTTTTSRRASSRRRVNRK